MSRSSFAVFRALEFIVGLVPLATVGLAFRMLRADRTHRSAASCLERSYSHVHIASLQELLGVLQGRCCRRTAKIDATELIVPADQVLQLRRAIHSRRPRRWPEPEETAG